MSFFSPRRPPPIDPPESLAAPETHPRPAPSIPDGDHLLKTMLGAKSGQLACQVLNQHLERHNAAWRAQPSEPTLGPVELVNLAREYNQTALIPDLIDRVMTEREARDRLAVARELRDRLAAGGVTHLYADTLRALMADGPVSAICHVLGARLEAAEPAIRADHGGGYGPDPKALDPEAINARRKQAVKASAKEAIR